MWLIGYLGRAGKKKGFGGSEIRSEIQKFKLQSCSRTQTNVPTLGAIAAKPRHQPWNPHIDASRKLCVLGLLANKDQCGIFRGDQLLDSMAHLATEPGHLSRTL